MSKILYRLADYANDCDRRQILGLYRDIYHMDFSGDYDAWFRDKKRDTIGIVAVDGTCEKIVGHWACARFDAVVAGERTGFRLDMGTMTAPEYRGCGIATTIFKNMQDEVIQRGDAKFIIGFPNEASYKMHLERLGFALQKDYHFVVLPRGKCVLSYRKETEFYKNQTDSFPGRNYVLHSEEHMKWHFQRDKYDKWRSGNGHLFISTRFKDKADILYWSSEAAEEDLLDFAAFLYEIQGVKRVTTWNSSTFFDAFPAEERNYHMCLQFLDSTPIEREELQREWFFYMGDCDLF